MSLCMQLLFTGERGKYHCDESALHVTKKREGEKGKNESPSHIVAHFKRKHKNINRRKNQGVSPWNMNKINKTKLTQISKR